MRAEKINALQGITVALRVPALPWIGTSRTADPHLAAPAAAPDPEVPVKAARRWRSAQRSAKDEFSGGI